jgi:hypothetical protein
MSKNDPSVDALHSFTPALEDDGPQPSRKLAVRVEAYNGIISIQPEGHGTCAHEDGSGWPIILTVMDGKLRVVLFDDINSEEPRVIDMSGARECLRVDANEEVL